MPMAERKTPPKSTEALSHQLHWLEKEQRNLTTRYHTEVARFSTWLSSSIIITIAFLLLGGLHTPKPLLLVFMYTALSSLALSMVAYLAAHMCNAQLVAAKLSYEVAQLDAKAKKATPKLEKAIQSWRSGLKAAQWAQQILFIIGLIAVVGFAIEVSLLFFTVPAAPAPAPSAQTGA